MQHYEEKKRRINAIVARFAALSIAAVHSSFAKDGGFWLFGTTQELADDWATGTAILFSMAGAEDKKCIQPSREGKTKAFWLMDEALQLLDLIESHLAATRAPHEYVEAVYHGISQDKQGQEPRA